METFNRLLTKVFSGTGSKFIVMLSSIVILAASLVSLIYPDWPSPFFNALMVSFSGLALFTAVCDYLLINESDESKAARIRNFLAALLGLILIAFLVTVGVSQESSSLFAA